MRGIINKEDSGIRTLINFSGGMDSAYVLYKYLKENPEEKFLVHHINLRHYKEDRMNRESIAVSNILYWLKSQGLDNFDYYESHFDYGGLPEISVKDIQIVAFFNGIILKTPKWSKINKIIISWHKGEVYDGAEDKKGLKVKSILRSLGVNPLPVLEYPIESLSRLDIVSLMPVELLHLASSCRRPTSEDNCGKCIPCKEFKKLGIFKEVGIVTDYLDYVY